VQASMATDRSWTWGPQGLYSGSEPFAEGPNGQRLVEYFDKSRMEINDPSGDPKSQWYVTNGLLVVEMMTGQITTGNNATQSSAPANVPVAGDPATSLNAPTYASLAAVASLKGNNRAGDHTGQSVQTSLASNGQQSQVPNLSGYAKYSVYEPTLGHNIPDVFWTFLNQSGTVYENGQYVTGLIVDWSYAMGYPLTEAYWINISVGGKSQWVLMQAYQRRILTFNPNNDPSFQVEMGNVGSSYYDWRYNGGGAAPNPAPAPTSATAPATAQPAAPTATPAPASLVLSPDSGVANSTVNVTGSNYPPYAAVMINVVASDIDYNQTVTTAAADGAGSFQAVVSLPAEVAQQNTVTVVGSANGGSLQSSQTFTIAHDPTFEVTPSQVTNVGVIQVSGDDWPANTDVTISAYQKTPDGHDTLIKSLKVSTDANGNFNETIQLAGQGQVGGTFNVVATAPDIKVSAKPYVQIIGAPTVALVPSTGPVGAPVVFQGASWPPNHLLDISVQDANGQVAMPRNPVVTDSAGNFSLPVVIPTAYAGQPYITVWATDGATNVTVQTRYTITK
jgi:hypothetical protein